ncbi:MAG TPA: hypothetical protein PK096_02080 [Candidatus Saccharibacteria bacterium]|nr:hypothetical protein [Candidatus Saccharibacteria bacterium]HRK94136.1 hypothetical protein [Candidatus Saccharibacteria bacterium]
MKSTDIAMIILIASVSVAVAYGVVSAIPGLKLSSDPVKVKTIERYTSTIDDPSSTVFSNSAINPTVDVEIGGTSAKTSGSTGTP